MWLAKAKERPACSVITMSHGDIIIVPREASASVQPQIPQVEASQLTRRSLQRQDAPLAVDPWAQAASKLPSAVKPQQDVVTQAQLRQLEDRLVAKLGQAQDRASDSDAEMVPDYEMRFKAMEEQIQQLQEGQRQQSIATQQIKLQVETQTKQFQQHVDHKMNEQLQQIQAMLDKRQRTAE